MSPFSKDETSRMICFGSFFSLNSPHPHPQGIHDIPGYEWAQNCTPEQFQKEGGIVYDNGEDALYNELQKTAPDNIYHLIEISSATSVGDVLQRLKSEVTKNIRLFAMGGSIYRDYENFSQPSKEYNVFEDTVAAQFMFNSSWAYFGLAPLDTTIFMQFNGLTWQQFLFYLWYNNGGKHAGGLEPFSPDIGTSTMYDVLAAILSLYYPKTITIDCNK
ncbi:unnamed protein product [Adineta ricciae]|uniref:Inosine/uridine-preferring nucleoside hydrolase domain-containing protein n=1 Tax=Adineta ricciae TaxID=249248 RepID=A0A815ULH5_ADIRI|nr:unnamed protein product [Adineta ricciae]CAF1521077.1 unnamed protein product [Adineta ricciae]